MYVEIKYRYSGEILISGEYKSLKDCVEKNKYNLTHANLTNADLTHADLTHANLTDTNLYCADLTGANLTDTNLTDTNLYCADLTGAKLTNACLKGAYLRHVEGNNKEIKNINDLNYSIAYTKDFLQIGCEGHLIEDWKEFDDEEIDEMDDYALEWWKENKEFIFKTIEKDPAI